MIQVEEMSKKFAKIYHNIDDINSLSIRIRLIVDSSPEKQDVAVFSWQEKRFSRQERERYQHEENCITDVEREYHQQLLTELGQGRRKKSASSTLSKNTPFKKTILFSYVQKDGISPNDSQYLRKSRRNPGKPDEEDKNNYLVNAIKGLALENRKRKQDDEAASVEVVENTRVPYDYFVFLNVNIVNPIGTHSTSDNMSWEAFYIMADFGELYNSIWIPSEYILCALKYNSKTKMLIANPDFTVFESYELKVTSDETTSYHYFAEIVSPQAETSASPAITEKTKDMTRYSNEKRINLRLPRDIHYVHVILEIQKGSGFEHDNVFVKWLLNLNGWRIKPCNETNRNGDVLAQSELAGVTISCRPSRFSKSGEKGDENVLHFGFPLEWHFLKDRDVSLVKDPVVYFELVSKDTWSRFRNEGATQLVLPLQLPGRHSFLLNCCRTTSYGLANELRRFFIGDSGNYNCSALSVEAGMNRLATTTISSGDLQVSVNVLHVFTGKHATGESFANLREVRLREKLRDPHLTKNVTNAVEAFKRARVAMLEARNAAIDEQQ